MKKVNNQKKIFIFVGIVVLLLVLGTVLIRCSHDNGDEKPAQGDGLGTEVYVKEEVDEDNLDIKDAEDAEQEDGTNTIDYNTSSDSNSEGSGTQNNHEENETSDNQDNENQEEQPKVEEPDTTPDTSGEYGEFF